MALQSTNIGINYQQRISAQFMLLMLCKEDIYNWLPQGKGTLTTIRFESMDKIDDLVLQTSYGTLYYLQIKRNINFSSSKKSEFYKVLAQFVGQFLLEKNESSMYCLVTSSDSSSQINNKLRRLLNNIRVGNSIQSLSMNKDDKNILEKFLTALKTIYIDKTNNEISNETLFDLCKRINILVFDIEEGQAQENVCKYLMASKSLKNISFLWSSLIVDALTFASNRSVVDERYMLDKYKTFFETDCCEDDSEYFTTESDGEVQIGYDIVLGRSKSLIDFLKQTGSEESKNYPDDALLLLQLYRFDENGKKDLSKYYPDNKLIMTGELEIEIIHRCSSITGMSRFIEKFKPEGSCIVNMLGNGDGQEDNYPAARAHKNWVDLQLSKLGRTLYCIHCERAITDNNCYIVEIDNEKESLKIGWAHIKCTRPIDRVVGKLKAPVFDTFDYLKGFDFNLWVNKKGQRLFADISQMPNKIYHILWSDDIRDILKGEYCLKANVQNGDAIYITQRGYVVRGSLEKIKAHAKDMNVRITLFSEDPIGFLSNSHQFGNYSALSTSLSAEEEFLRCISFECVPFTSTIKELYDITTDYYAPLAYLSTEDSIVLFDGIIFLLTNPLKLDKYLENWNDKMGYDIGNNYLVKTIANDEDFDMFVGNVINNVNSIIVDPWFGDKNELLHGIFIDSYEKEKERV